MGPDGNVNQFYSHPGCNGKTWLSHFIFQLDFWKEQRLHGNSTGISDDIQADISTVGICLYKGYPRLACDHILICLE
jgi:hypothetical protein